MVTASLLITLILLEIFARATHLGTGGFWEPHPLYGWRNIPNASGWESCYGECSVFVKINSQGLRNRETPYQKAAGRKRILFLGDSLTAAMQVAQEDTFAQVLENGLNETDSGAPWEVINAGVNAFGTDNELLFFRLEASKYQPDVVILGVYLANDIYNNSRALEQRLSGSGHKPYFEFTDGGELVLKNFPVENADTLFIRLGSFLKRYFQLPRFLAETLNLRKQVPEALRPLIQLAGGQRGASSTTPQGNTESGNLASNGSTARLDICADVYAPQVEQAWAITRALIKQLRAEVEASGAQFAAMVIPAAPQLEPPTDGEQWYCDRPNLELAEFLESEGIPYLDLLEPFRQHMLQGGDSLYYQRDFHMNAEGHRLAGKLLSPFVIEWLR